MERCPHFHTHKQVRQYLMGSTIVSTKRFPGSWMIIEQKWVNQFTPWVTPDDKQFDITSKLAIIVVHYQTVMKSVFGRPALQNSYLNLLHWCWCWFWWDCMLLILLLISLLMIIFILMLMLMRHRISAWSDQGGLHSWGRCGERSVNIKWHNQ